MIIDTLILMKDAAIIFFVWSYSIGKFIVSALCLIARSLYVSAEKLSDLLQIVVGDFKLFINDVNRDAGYLMNSVGEAGNFCLWIIDQVISCSIKVSMFFWYGTYNLFRNVYIPLEGSIIFINDLVKQVGLALWFLIMIPNTLLKSTVQCIYDLYEFIVEIRRFILGLCVSFKEVPVESIAGVIFIAVIIYVLFRFRKLLRSICRKWILLLYLSLKFNILKLPLNRIWPGYLKRVSRTNETIKVSDDSYLCIICQSDTRCIVLMPCKHLCLCEKCSIRLAINQTSNCPICRQQIFFRIKVYV